MLPWKQLQAVKFGCFLYFLVHFNMADINHRHQSKTFHKSLTSNILSVCVCVWVNLFTEPVSEVKALFFYMAGPLPI